MCNYFPVISNTFPSFSSLPYVALSTPSSAGTFSGFNSNVSRWLRFSSASTIKRPSAMISQVVILAGGV